MNQGQIGGSFRILLAGANPRPLGMVMVKQH